MVNQENLLWLPKLKSSPTVVTPGNPPAPTLNYAKQTQFTECQINVNKVLTKDYENVRLRGRRPNKPNQSQFQSHRLYAYFKLFARDVIRRKLCSVTVYPIRGSLYLREVEMVYKYMLI